MRPLPSNGRLTALSLALAVGGIAVSAYLTLVHYRDDLLVCAVGGCHTVQKSPYAELSGVPVAILGLGMFVMMALLGLLRRSGRSGRSASPLSPSGWRWPARYSPSI